MKIIDCPAHSGLTPDTIRYREVVGLLPRTVRDRGGRRSYDLDDPPRRRSIAICKQRTGRSAVGSNTSNADLGVMTRGDTLFLGNLPCFQAGQERRPGSSPKDAGF